MVAFSFPSRLRQHLLLATYTLTLMLQIPHPGLLAAAAAAAHPVSHQDIQKDGQSSFSGYDTDKVELHTAYRAADISTVNAGSSDDALLSVSNNNDESENGILWSFRRYLRRQRYLDNKNDQTKQEKDLNTKESKELEDTKANENDKNQKNRNRGYQPKNQKGENDKNVQRKKPNSRQDKIENLDWDELDELDITSDMQEIAISKEPSNVPTPIPSSSPSASQAQLSSQANSINTQEIKTGLVSDDKSGDNFDDQYHAGGIKEIRADTGTEINGIQLVYRTDARDGGWYGKGKPGDFQHTLLDDEEIIGIEAKTHAGNYGMEYIIFFTDRGNQINVTTDGNDGGDGDVETFQAPSGYVLGGIHGMTGGSYNNTLINIGFYWVKFVPIPLYEAEDYTSKTNCTFGNDTSNAGYHGEGYMDIGSADSYIEWNNINVQEARQYQLRIRYANGDPSTDSRECLLFLNDESAASVDLPFYSTGRWGNYGDELVVVSLEQGNNTVRIQSVGDGPNIDFVTIIPYDSIAYTPGDFSKGRRENGIFLANGLRSTIVAEKDMSVDYWDGSSSALPFHSAPDGAAIFPGADGTYAYVSNSEVGNQDNQGQGGAGTLIFRRDGKVQAYKRVLSGTTRNCSGGKTPWGTFLSCEEYRDGKVWEVEPFGEPSFDGKSYQETTLHRSTTGEEHPDFFEAVACDNRDPFNLTCYVTVDMSDGDLRRFKVDQNQTKSASSTGNYKGVLTSLGDVTYLVLDDASRTFSWTTDKSLGMKSAEENFRNCEGMEFNEKTSTLYFVSKVQKELFALDLTNPESGPYEKISTYENAFPGQPDQLKLVCSDSDEDVLYFSEDGGDCGVYGRNQGGQILQIVDTDDCSMGETTGLAISPDKKYLYFAAQGRGRVYQLWREDMKPFGGDWNSLSDAAVNPQKGPASKDDGAGNAADPDSVPEWVPDGDANSTTAKLYVTGTPASRDA